jgi:DNA-binding IclR family transcriptional regulator
MSRAPTRDLLAANFEDIAPDLVSRLVEVLSQGRQAFGDLDRVLILLVICERSKLRGPRRGWTNIRSIAESTGLPRETVRRKVVQLADEGLISREGNRLTLLPAAESAAQATRAAIVDMAAANAELAERLLARKAA